ncbi:thiamine-phosphate kinase [Alkalibacillus silvisoli]|uniref:Thiamine-monophosphate kinase n=1 Tax=Alkalibacillus silvisoli TaxID=392823 RepID=A0ABP3JJ17_9BACI
MKEFDFIKQITPSFYKQSSVVKGIGDDGAVIKPPNGHELVVVADAMVEGVHFSLDYMSFHDVGHRVLAANVSDLCAMGSTPLYYIVTISVPTQYTKEDISQLYNGMQGLAKSFNMDLIGGDTTSSDQLMISITAFGSVLSNQKRLRSQAELGDLVFVTGYLGESGYGLHLLEKKEPDSYFINRHKRPVPRYHFIQASSRIDRLSLNDISDGISTELNEIAEASSVDITINYSQLPVHTDMATLQEDWLRELVLSAGEDFELVGTCSKEAWVQLEDACHQFNIPITSIGQVRMQAGERPTVKLREEERDIVLDREGYEHS